MRNIKTLQNTEIIIIVFPMHGPDGFIKASYKIRFTISIQYFPLFIQFLANTNLSQFGANQKIYLFYFSY